MTSQSSDGLFVGYPEFTEEDFKRVDAAVTQACAQTEDVLTVEKDVLEASFQSEIDGLNLQHLTEEDWAKLDNGLTGEGSSGSLDASFASDIDGLNMGTLTEDDFARLDAAISSLGEPAVPVELESDSSGSSPSQKPSKTKRKSPLRLFRRKAFLSVTDLANPAWCEVQFDYGLRGKRSRPINERPTSFKSSTGKIIAVEQNIAKKKDVQTKQGLSVHKELEREVREKELKVDITTKETRWALRIVNMLACFKELLHGPRHMTREMPIFGILHDEVIIGIIDEVEEVHRSAPPLTRMKRKRSNDFADPASGAPPQKRTASIGSQTVSLNHSDNAGPIGEKLAKPSRFLLLRDAKTRKDCRMPDERDSLPGRLQLYIYHTLLCNLITCDPPFDFGRLWTKLGVNPDAKLPTKFLVQAQLIRPSSGDFETISLNDLAASFHQMIKSENLKVNRVLELVYYRRPTSKERKGKNVGTSSDQTQIPSLGDVEDANLAQAIAMSLESPAFKEPGSSYQAPPIENEDLGLATAIARSLEKPASVSEGIRSFPIIGRRTFFYDPHEMNGHISHILKWWRGERQPEGVPIEFAYRCRSCEYANDCEWRIAKASELRNKVH